MVYQYRQKFYLNTSHYITINDKVGDIHSHCFEIVLNLATINKDKFVQFNKIEESINKILAPYQDTLINTVSPFNVLNPTVENMSIYFSDIFNKAVKEFNWCLVNIEISETPTRAFIYNVIEDEEINNK